MIRLMEEQDIPQLARLFLKSRRHTFHWVDPARFQLEDFEEQTKGEQVWVAEQGAISAGLSPSGSPTTSSITSMSQATGTVRGSVAPCLSGASLIRRAARSRWRPATRRH